MTDIKSILANADSKTKEIVEKLEKQIKDYEHVRESYDQLPVPEIPQKPEKNETEESGS